MPYAMRRKSDKKYRYSHPFGDATWRDSPDYHNMNYSSKQTWMEMLFLARDTDEGLDNLEIVEIEIECVAKAVIELPEEDEKEVETEVNLLVKRRDAYDELEGWPWWKRLFSRLP